MKPLAATRLLPPLPIILLASLLFLGVAPAATLRLDSLDLNGMTCGWGVPRKNRAVTDVPLSIGGVSWEHGVGTHAESEWSLVLDGKAEWFSARVGVDDNAGNDRAAIEFIVLGDGRELWKSGICRWKEPARDCRDAGSPVLERSAR